MIDVSAQLFGIGSQDTGVKFDQDFGYIARQTVSDGSVATADWQGEFVAHAV